MIRTVLAASAASLTLGAAASAQDAMMPQSDYWMSTTVDADGRQLPMEMSHNDGTMRIETSFEGQQAVILLDMMAEDATILIDAQGMRMAMDIPASEADYTPEAPDSLPDPIGSDTVAGEPCDIYRVDDPDTGETGDMCMTEDAIILRVESEGQVVFEAEEFERGPQDPSLFEVPEGYQRMQMPSGMGGMMPGPQ